MAKVEAGRRRYLVGIDLGTTNSALCTIDSARSRRDLECLPVTQLVAPGILGQAPTLPSLHHHVGEHELPPEATRLPWTKAEAPAPSYVVGELARQQAQVVPGRSVSSAKSWLCHPRVDRLADILPWGGLADVPRLSPVEVSARYLRHLQAAFAQVIGAMGQEGADGAGFGDAEVVLTVPASFDEVARELTVEAARRAGLPMEHLTLLEEPQAAFYSWLADHARYAEEVEAGDLIFVCDIGGGTTDFTLIEVQKTGGRIAFQRTAVGDHLLLGGDNMDLALSRRLERQLMEEPAPRGGDKGRGAPLPPHSFQALVQSCQKAKERLLGEEAPEEFSVHVAGRGARLIGGGLRAELRKRDVEETLLDGFFPQVAREAEPQRARLGLQEMGLPYAPDPAVTRYMAAFLRQQGAELTCVLFNGGVLRAAAIRARILDVLERWFGRRPRVLTNDAPDLSVARGAAYYGLSRRGEGLRISGGAARAFYVEVAVAAASPGSPEGDDRSAATYVCLTPRGLEEGTEVDVLHLGGGTLQLLTNRPVRFRLFSSSTRQGDKPGDVLRLPAGTLEELPPLYTVLRHARSSQERPMDVALRARLTELGTLELWAVAEQAEEGAARQKWRLQFDLRGPEGQGGQGAAGNQGAAPADGSATEAPLAQGQGTKKVGAAVQPGDGDGDGGEPGDGAAETLAQAGLIAAATEHIDAVFAGAAPPQGLPRALQAVLGPRDGWSPSVLRPLWEPLKGHAGRRGKSAAHEARWLNLSGFCLRPGFGYPLDDWRVKEAWRVWNGGLQSERDEACRLEWWILWRRLAGGLSRNQQEEIWKRVAPLLLPGQKRIDKKPPGPQEAQEIWRAIAACERLEVKKKVELGEAALALLPRRGELAWALGRLGARLPLYGSMDNVVSPQVAERWIGGLLSFVPPEGAEARADLGQTAAELGRRSGDRVRDIGERTREALARWLEGLLPGSEGERLARVVREVVPRQDREERFAFGDSLPVGLRLAFGEAEKADPSDKAEKADPSDKAEKADPSDEAEKADPSDKAEKADRRAVP